LTKSTDGGSIPPVTTVIETRSEAVGSIVINTQNKEVMRMKNTIKNLVIVGFCFVSVTFQGSWSTKGHK
jgi:hypothetical protein